MSIPPWPRIRWPEAATALVRPVGSIDPAVAFRSECQLRNLRGRGEWRKKKNAENRPVRIAVRPAASGAVCGRKRGFPPFRPAQRDRIANKCDGIKSFPSRICATKKGRGGGLRPLRAPFGQPPGQTGSKPGAGCAAARSGNGAWKRRTRRSPAGFFQRRISWSPGLPAVRRGPGGRARCAWRIPNGAWRSSARPSDNPPAAPISGGSRPATCRRSSADSA